MLYISPLRALAVDIEKNLRAPLGGMELAAERLDEPCHVPVVGVRTGDTQKERAALLRTPPDILITTPESLYLMLTSRAREMLRSLRLGDHRRDPRPARPRNAARTSRCRSNGSRRSPTSPPQRIGLSATQRPLDEMAHFLGGQTTTAPGP